MGDEAKPIDVQDDGTVAAEAAAAGAGPESIADIVDSLGFDGTPDAATPATEPAASGTGEGDSAKPKTDEAPSAPKVELYSEEQLDKFTLKDYENPSFDWSKVPPDRAKAVKAAIALVTPERQRIAAAKKALAEQERNQKPPQPTEETEEERLERTNRDIVAKHLGELTGVSDPKIIGQMAENLIYTQAVEIAGVPEYSTDETFSAAVNEEIASNPMLMAAAESRNPQIIAQAIQLGVKAVRAKALESNASSVEQRAKDLDAREQKLKAAETELEQERAKLNRGRSTVAGGARSGAAPKGSAGTLREIVDGIDGPWNS